MAFYPRSFNSWWAALHCALSEWGVSYTVAVRTQAREEFQRDWNSIVPPNRPDPIERGYEMTDWVNRNYEKVEEWALDYLIAKGY